MTALSWVHPERRNLEPKSVHPKVGAARKEMFRARWRANGQPLPHRPSLAICVHPGIGRVLPWMPMLVKGTWNFSHRGIWATDPRSAPTREVKVYTGPEGLSAHSKRPKDTIRAPPDFALQALFARIRAHLQACRKRCLIVSPLGAVRATPNRRDRR